ncbi:MAG: tRNA lysidine(34) synthetase TilS [Micrococcales bacterium]|nr:tRNA lysidine(34) synthetase TilS [Micrococcales bacterium]
MTGPDPAVAAIRLAVRQSLAGLPVGSTVLVACSGGTDSLALAAATGFVAPRLELKAGAVVVDHGLQAKSDDVANQAAQACRAIGLAPVEVVKVQLKGPANVEAEARDQRYQALEATAAAHQAAAVLLGHSLDDQAETVLLALGRGSGLTALAGMPAARGPFIRPLLGITRQQTERACRALDLQPWQDPMNQLGGPGYSARVLLRQHILPQLEDALGGGVAAALARTAGQVRQDLDYLDSAAAQLLTRVTSGGQVDAKVLSQAKPALRHRAIKQMALEWGADPAALSAAHVKALDALTTAWHGQGAVALPGGVKVGRECGKLVVLETAVAQAVKEIPSGSR